MEWQEIFWSGKMNKKVRCAIYTRKSSEEGLEQDFNSLDAQREACEAYIKSQMHEGWTLLEKQYNDGGFSGGTMERPAFKELLADIEKDEVDIVVVYKVDRLTRSLMDFSKIIEVFDNHNASFVSITQHFNTTTSMGRLTLNILLSFAQFEREVTGERIRDKFAASRQKGLWLTGAPPYGYKKDEHNILITEKPYSQNLKTIFEIYLKLGTVNKLRDYLIENEIVSKNCKPFSSGNLYKILSNKVYLGKIVHKDKVFDGQHEAIISEELFERVQELLKSNAVIRKHAINAKEGSLLTGLLFDDKGNRMIPSHSNKSGRRYRYYVSQAMQKPDEFERGEVTKISAGEIENYAKNEVLKLIKNKQLMQKHLADFAIEQQNDILLLLSNFEPDKIFIRTIIKQIDLHSNYIEILFDIDYLIKYAKALVYNRPVELESSDENLVTIKQDIKLSMTPQKQNKIIISGQRNYDMKLIQAIVKSFWYNKLGAERRLPSEARNGNVKKLRKLRFLPPEIIESIINGTQDPELNISKLIAMVK